MFLIKLITGHKKYGFKFYEKSYPASHLQRDHRYIGGSALILSERPDIRSLGREKWNLLLKTFKMSPQTSPNSLSFTHINFLRLSEIVGQSHCISKLLKIIVKIGGKLFHFMVNPAVQFNDELSI